MTQDEFQLHVIETLGRLDEKLASLAGNGQPGRVGRLEDQVEDLKQARWTIAGAIIAIGTGITSLIHFVFK